MNDLTEEQRTRQAELLATCRQFSGEYRPGHHGKASWATTYSDDFVAAAADLCLLYQRAGCAEGRDSVTRLQTAFRSFRISSCRGGIFTYDTTKYLYWNLIIPEFKRRGLMAA